MKFEREIKYPDYKKIREESCRMDCTIVEADFNTNHPHTYRVDYAANDIKRYLKYKDGGKVYGFKY